MGTIETVRNCLKLLFGAESASQEARQADRWLNDFQKGEEAWAVADELLRTTATDAIAQSELLFGASTLHKKIRYDFSELDAAHVPALRASLVSHIGRFKKASRALIIRLSLAIAALAVQTSWLEIIPELTAHFSTDPDTVMCLLEILTVLPEECHSGCLQVEETQRYAFADSLCRLSEQVLQTLVHTMSMVGNNADLQGRVFRCVQSWLTDCRIPPAVLAKNPLLTGAFDALVSEPLFDCAVDVIVCVLRNYDSSEQNLPVVHVTVPRVMALQARYRQAVQDADEDTARQLCRMFVEMSESYISLILGSADAGPMTVVQMVLECSNHSEPEIATIPLHFWYRFTASLEQVPPDNRQRFIPCLSTLVTICLRLMHYPEGYADWPEDRKEDQRRLRYDVADTLEDAARLIGSAACLALIYGKFQQEVKTYGDAIAAGSATSHWEGVEACLFALRTIARQIPHDESAFTPHIMSVLPQFHVGHALVRYTSTLVVGSFSGWVERHAAAHLGPLFTFVVGGLAAADVAPASALALLKLCQNCGKHLGEPVLGQLGAQLSPQTCTLPQSDQLLVLEALCSVISTLPPEPCWRCLEQLVTPYVSALQQLIIPGAPESSDKAVVAVLDKFTTVIRSVKIKSVEGAPVPQGTNHPVVRLFGQLWPFLVQAMQQHHRSARVVENVCRTFKHTLRSGGKHMESAVPALGRQLNEWYTAAPHSPFLYAASIVVSEFGSDPAHEELLSSMLQAMTSKTLSVLRELPDFTEHPDVVEEFFYLVARFMKHSTGILVKLQGAGLLTAVTHMGVCGWTVQHREANRSILHFFEKLVDLGCKARPGEPGRVMVEQLLGQGDAGQNLVKAACSSVAGLYRVHDDEGGSIVGVLWALRKFNVDVLRNWLIAVLSQMPDAQLTAEHKQTFLQAMCAEVRAACTHPSR
jgi:transportin-3